VNYEDPCDRIMTLCQALTWLKQAPDDPPGAAVQFPFAAVFPERGESLRQTDERRDLHTVALEVHWAYKDMPRQVGDAKDRLDDILNMLWYDLTLNSTVDHIGRGDGSPGITYEFGPMSWGSIQTLGFIFHITFKQHTTVSA